MRGVSQFVMVSGRRCTPVRRRYRGRFVWRLLTRSPVPSPHAAGQTVLTMRQGGAVALLGHGPLLANQAIVWQYTSFRKSCCCKDKRCREDADLACH